jgi:hypothetical protein
MIKLDPIFAVKDEEASVKWYQQVLDSAKHMVNVICLPSTEFHKYGD